MTEAVENRDEVVGRDVGTQLASQGDPLDHAVTEQRRHKEREPEVDKERGKGRVEQLEGQIEADLGRAVGKRRESDLDPDTRLVFRVFQAQPLGQAEDGNGVPVSAPLGLQDLGHQLDGVGEPDLEGYNGHAVRVEERGRFDELELGLDCRRPGRPVCRPGPRDERERSTRVVDRYVRQRGGRVEPLLRHRDQQRFHPVCPDVVTHNRAHRVKGRHPQQDLCTQLVHGPVVNHVAKEERADPRHTLKRLAMLAQRPCLFQSLSQRLGHHRPSTL